MQRYGVGLGGKPLLQLVLRLLGSLTCPVVYMHCKYLNILILRRHSLCAGQTWSFLGSLLSFHRISGGPAREGYDVPTPVCAGQWLTTRSPEKNACVNLLKFILNFTGMKDM